MNYHLIEVRVVSLFCLSFMQLFAESEQQNSAEKYKLQRPSTALKAPPPKKIFH